MAKGLTQKEMILQYIRDFGSITPIDAFRDLGITKLATRVSEMKRDGIQFNTVTEKSKNRYGKTCWYARYTLCE